MREEERKYVSYVLKKKTQLKHLSHNFAIKMWLKKNKPKFRTEVRRLLLSFRRTHWVI